ncbi:hypothetical protein E2C01_076495 [Portunus trituberculatus]|uniref:Uncharacterized protein n=1 Tax=Portunus trituberculatus TaxID=210409 RepID=A0A5B7IJW6_PORTR|nr:hypothetical protein [Portunus trituberculatus]
MEGKLRNNHKNSNLTVGGEFGIFVGSWREFFELQIESELARAPPAHQLMHSLMLRLMIPTVKVQLISYTLPLLRSSPL